MKTTKPSTAQSPELPMDPETVQPPRLPMDPETRASLVEIWNLLEPLTAQFEAQIAAQEAQIAAQTED